MSMNNEFDELVYQEGVAARVAGRPGKSPYENIPHKNYYWRRGYADGAEVKSGELSTFASHTPREFQMLPNQMEATIEVKTDDGQDFIMLRYRPWKCRLTLAEMRAFGEHVERLLNQNPFHIPNRVIDRGKEYYLRDESRPSGGTSTARAARVIDGVVRIPEGAKVGPDGEIIVPARSLDSSSPNAKSFRRACRSARNAIRLIAEKDGRPVSVVTQEMMEKS